MLYFITVRGLRRVEFLVFEEAISQEVVVLIFIRV